MPLVSFVMVANRKVRTDSKKTKDKIQRGKQKTIAPTESRESGGLDSQKKIDDKTDVPSHWIITNSVSTTTEDRTEQQSNKAKKTLAEEVEDADRTTIERENKGKITHYGNAGKTYTIHSDVIYQKAAEMYAASTKDGADSEQLFSYMGRFALMENSKLSGKQQQGDREYDQETQRYGQLAGKDAQSIINRVYLQELFGDATIMTLEERLKYRYWKWFNSAERRLYERQSPFHQTPYWQLAGSLDLKNEHKLF